MIEISQAASGHTPLTRGIDKRMCHRRVGCARMVGQAETVGMIGSAGAIRHVRVVGAKVVGHN